MTMMLAIAVVTASAQTKKQLFDFGWQFTHRSALPLGSSKNGKTQTVDLPHDWDIFDLSQEKALPVLVADGLRPVRASIARPSRRPTARW